MTPSLIDRKTAGYFKLAAFCPRSFTWKDGKTAYPSEGDAVAAAASKPGQYRVSRVDADGRHDLTPFSV
jgi:hypothetical protein